MENKEREFTHHKDEFDKRRRDHRFYKDDHHRGNKRHHGPKIIETKLFVSKSELVEYVNEKGQGSAILEIFKIEDGLYKLVIKE